MRNSSIYNFLVRHSFFTSALVVIILSVIFFPSGYTTVDEHDYLDSANLILYRNLKQECDETNITQFPVEDYCIYKYNLGSSLFYLPQALLKAPQLAFLSTIIVFIFGIYIFNELLKLLKVNIIFTYGFTFYPALIYYSRTLFSEIYSVTFILVMLYLLIKYFKTRYMCSAVLTGVVMSMLLFIKYTHIIYFAALFGFYILENISRYIILEKQTLKDSIVKVIKKYTPILLGMLPGTVLILLTNLDLYGHPFRSGYYYSGEELLLNFQQFPAYLGTYILILIVLYPGMLLFAFLSRKHPLKMGILASSIVMIVFYSVFPSGLLEGRLLDAIIGIRLIVPYIPPLMLLYFKFLSERVPLGHKYLQHLIVLVIIGLFATSTTLSAVHQKYVDANKNSWGKNHLTKLEQSLNN